MKMFKLLMLAIFPMIMMTPVYAGGLSPAIVSENPVYIQEDTKTGFAIGLSYNYIQTSTQLRFPGDTVTECKFQNEIDAVTSSIARFTYEDFPPKPEPEPEQCVETTRQEPDSFADFEYDFAETGIFINYTYDFGYILVIGELSATEQTKSIDGAIGFDLGMIAPYGFVGGMDFNDERGTVKGVGANLYVPNSDVILGLRYSETKFDNSDQSFNMSSIRASYHF